MVGPQVPKTTSTKEASREALLKIPLIASFSKMAGEYLQATERPNIITLEQFRPFIAMFNADKTQYIQDLEFRRHIDNLWQRWTRELDINIFYPTIVIESKDNPKELYFLKRMKTRIRPDDTDGQSHQNSVPSAVSKVSPVTREDLLLNASLQDILEANSSPDQMKKIWRIKGDESLIMKKFVENNLSPEKREALLKENSPTEEITSFESHETTLFDDD